MNGEIRRPVPPLEQRLELEAFVLAHGDEPAVVDERVDLDLLEAAAFERHRVHRPETGGWGSGRASGVGARRARLRPRARGARARLQLLHVFGAWLAVVDPYHDAGLLEELGHLRDGEVLLNQLPVAVRPGVGHRRGSSRTDARPASSSCRRASPSATCRASWRCASRALCLPYAQHGTAYRHRGCGYGCSAVCGHSAREARSTWAVPANASSWRFWRSKRTASSRPTGSPSSSGAADGEKERASLHAYISNLRRVLEPDRDRSAPSSVLVRQSPGYRLVVDNAAVIQQLAG